MLVRNNYYDENRNKIKYRVLKVLKNLVYMIEHYDSYMDNPSEKNRQFILEIESYVDKNERKIEKHILEAISLKLLNLDEIKWLLGMNRIIRDLERIGDQVINIVTISDVQDVHEMKPMIQTFFDYERMMFEWLIKGIEKDNPTALKNVMKHDQHINRLNKGTYKDVADSINDRETITESRLKMIIISRFLERIGDHLVNVSRIYLDLLNEIKGRRDVE